MEDHSPQGMGGTPLIHLGFSHHPMNSNSEGGVFGGLLPGESPLHPGSVMFMGLQPLQPSVPTNRTPTSVAPPRKSKGRRLSVAGVDAQATKNDAAWSTEEEQELVRLATDEPYRKSVLGDIATKWAPIACHFSRTVKAVKRKFDKLQNPEKEKESLRKLQVKTNKQKAEAAAAADTEATTSAPPPPPNNITTTANTTTTDALPEIASLPHTAITVAAHNNNTLSTFGEGMSSWPYDITGGGITYNPYNQVLSTGGGSEEDGDRVLSLHHQNSVNQEQMMAYYHFYSDQPPPSINLTSAAIKPSPHHHHNHQDILAMTASVDPHQQMMAVHMAAGYQSMAAAASGGGLGGGGGSGVMHGFYSPSPVPAISPPGSADNDIQQQQQQQQEPQPRKNDKVFWKADEQQKLLRLANEPEYRRQILGTEELDWDRIARHMGRGKRSVQRKFDNLKTVTLDVHGNIVLPANDGKKWSDEEVEDLIRLVQDNEYRLQKLNIDKVDWRVLGAYFGRSHESVSYKYGYVKNTGKATAQQRKQKHTKSKHETSYKEMAIWALQQLDGIGSSGQICAQIEKNEAYIAQLDKNIVSGKKTLPRWKHGVRSALNAFDLFVKTGAFLAGETVWELDKDKLPAVNNSQEEGGDGDGEGGGSQETSGQTKLPSPTTTATGTKDGTSKKNASSKSTAVKEGTKATGADAPAATSKGRKDNKRKKTETTTTAPAEKVVATTAAPRSTKATGTVVLGLGEEKQLPSKRGRARKSSTTAMAVAVAAAVSQPPPPVPQSPPAVQQQQQQGADQQQQQQPQTPQPEPPVQLPEEYQQHFPHVTAAFFYDPAVGPPGSGGSGHGSLLPPQPSKLPQLPPGVLSPEYLASIPPEAAAAMMLQHHLHNPSAMPMTMTSMGVMGMSPLQCMHDLPPLPGVVEQQYVAVTQQQQPGFVSYPSVQQHHHPLFMMEHHHHGHHHQYPVSPTVIVPAPVDGGVGVGVVPQVQHHQESVDALGAAAGGVVSGGGVHLQLPGNYHPHHIQQQYAGTDGTDHMQYVGGGTEQWMQYQTHVPYNNTTATSASQYGGGPL